MKIIATFITMNAHSEDSANLFEMKFQSALGRANDERVIRLQQSATRRKAEINTSETLSESQRKAALEMLRQQTEEEMRRALGEQEFSAFRALHHWWFRELATAA